MNFKLTSPFCSNESNHEIPSLALMKHETQIELTGNKRFIDSPQLLQVLLNLLLAIRSRKYFAKKRHSKVCSIKLPHGWKVSTPFALASFIARLKPNLLDVFRGRRKPKSQQSGRSTHCNYTRASGVSLDSYKLHCKLFRLNI